MFSLLEFSFGVDSFLGKCRVWAPLGRGPRGTFFHHLINLLKRQTLGLWDKEVRIHEASSAKASPDEEDRGLHVGLTRVLSYHVRSDDSNDGIPQPVGGSGESNTAGADRNGEDFSNQNPGAGAPGGCEEEDVDGNKCDLGIDGRNIVGNGTTTVTDVGLVEANSNAEDSDDELTDEHTQGAEDQKRAATELLDSVEGDGS